MPKVKQEQVRLYDAGLGTFVRVTRFDNKTGKFSIKLPAPVAGRLGIDEVESDNIKAAADAFDATIRQFTQTKPLKKLRAIKAALEWEDRTDDDGEHYLEISLCVQRLDQIQRCAGTQDIFLAVDGPDAGKAVRIWSSDKEHCKPLTPEREALITGIQQEILALSKSIQARMRKVGFIKKGAGE